MSGPTQRLLLFTLYMEVHPGPYRSMECVPNNSTVLGPGTRKSCFVNEKLQDYLVYEPWILLSGPLGEETADKKGAQEVERGDA